MLKFFSTMMFIFILGSHLYSQQFVYVPVNPSFGGNYFMGSYLLSVAQAQNGFTAGTSGYQSYQSDPLQSFKSSLNSQILSLLSRDLITKVFGEDSFSKAGKYEIGDYIIEVTPGGEGIHIDITDIVKGGSTTIDIPYY